ncbi:MAG: DUF308 domain-containing protein [Propionibacteriaceae bacterium]|jgi:uncharacterized membrane protein HdeD (DUF308 family)|nr:DUF308 domain-containing protein [Propionibacteriaceae bacterium]
MAADSSSAPAGAANSFPDGVVGSFRAAFQGLIPPELQRQFGTLTIIRGVLAILIGAALLFAPLMAMAVIAMVIGIWLIVDGIVEITRAWRMHKDGVTDWGWVLAAAIISVVVGLLVAIFPLSTAFFGGLLLLWIFGIGLVVRGIVLLAQRQYGGWGIALGIIDIVFGVVMIGLTWFNPAATLFALIWVAAIYGFVAGISLIVAGASLRNQVSSSQKAQEQPRHGMDQSTANAGTPAPTAPMATATTGAAAGATTAAGAATTMTGAGAPTTGSPAATSSTAPVADTNINWASGQPQDKLISAGSASSAS